jgi:hypothetical protein
MAEPLSWRNGNFPLRKKTLVRFSMLLDSHIAVDKTPGAKPDPVQALFKTSAVHVEPGLSDLYVKDASTNALRPLGNQYYDWSKFDDCVISHNGGPLYFDDNNEITDSYLYLYPGVDMKDPKFKSLIQNHEWLQVIY